MLSSKKEPIPNIIKSGTYWRTWISPEGYEDYTMPVLLNCTGYAWLDRAFKTERTRCDYYLMFMDKGTIKMKSGDDFVDFTKNQFIIHNKETPYKYYMEDPDEPTGYYWVHFTGFWAEELLKKAGIETDTIYTCDGNMSDLTDIFKSLFREVFKREKNFETDTAALIMRLIIKLGKIINPEWMDKVKTLRFKNSISFIHTNYAKNIDVKTLADMEGLSVSRYRALFREMTGVAPAEYIINLKIEKACELLFCTNYSVTDVAAMCGYNDVLYFIRLFKKKIGITPGKYKESRTKNIMPQ